MAQHLIAEIVVGLPVDGPFDYGIPDNLMGQVAVGQRVQVMFNRRKRVGYVVGFKEKSRFKKLNFIFAVLDESHPSLGEEELQLTKTFSEYYGCSWGEAIEAFFPPALRKAKKVVVPAPDKRVSRGEGSSELLYDSDSEKRWAFLRSRIQEVLREKRQVIFLVPENYYVLQVEKELAATGATLAAIHGRLPVAKDVELWQNIKHGDVDVVIGTRSSVFAPLPRLGLIVIYDEEHIAYKQEQAPHYHVHEVSLMRQKIDRADVVFVSSVPSAEIWHMAKRHKWPVTGSPEKHQAKVSFVDMTNYNPRKSSLVSYPLQNELAKFIKEGKQSLIFLSQRDFSPWTDETNGKVVSARSERVMEFFKRFYPDKSVAYYEAKTKKFPFNADVVIGSPAVFRERRRFRPALVGVINADSQLNYFDFRAGHKTFSLLTHLRQLATERMVIQTKMHEHYCIQSAQKSNHTGFYREELKFRKELGFPPFRHLVEVGVRGLDEKKVSEQSNQIYEKLSALKPKSVEISNPYANPTLKLQDKSRYTTMLKSKSVQPMVRLVKKALGSVRRKSGVIVTINVDP